MSSNYQVDTWILEEIAKSKNYRGTSDGMKALDLSNEVEHYRAGNMYLALLRTIKNLLEERDGRPY